MHLKLLKKIIILSGIEISWNSFHFSKMSRFHEWLSYLNEIRSQVVNWDNCWKFRFQEKGKKMLGQQFLSSPMKFEFSAVKFKFSPIRYKNSISASIFTFNLNKFETQEFKSMTSWRLIYAPNSKWKIQVIIHNRKYSINSKFGITNRIMSTFGYRIWMF